MYKNLFLVIICFISLCGCDVFETVESRRIHESYMKSKEEQRKYLYPTPQELEQRRLAEEENKKREEEREKRRVEGIRKILNAWMGYTKHELLLKLGAPFSTNPDGAGGEILAFVYKTAYVVGYTQVETYSFYINSSGKIYWGRHETQFENNTVLKDRY